MFFEVGNKVRIKDYETLCELEDCGPGVTEEMFEMAEGVYRIERINSNGNMYICGWWFSREMVEPLIKITEDSFIEVLKTKTNNAKKVSLYELAEFIGEAL